MEPSKVEKAAAPEFQFAEGLRSLGAMFHAHDLLLKLGRTQIGEPNKRQIARLRLIVDLERLDRIAIKLLTAKNWDALLRTT